MTSINQSPKRSRYIESATYAVIGKYFAKLKFWNQKNMFHKLIRYYFQSIKMVISKEMMYRMNLRIRPSALARLMLAPPGVDAPICHVLDNLRTDRGDPATQFAQTQHGKSLMGDPADHPV